MVTREPINSAEMSASTPRTGRAGVLYVDQNDVQWLWDATAARFQRMDRLSTDRTGAAVAGTATVTTAQLLTGSLVFSGGAGTQTLPTATLLGTALNAKQGTVFDFSVDNTAGSGTCTIAVGAGMTAAAVITGGNTLTVGNSATVGVAQFRLHFFSATGAVLYRLG